jgi:hypothetical protein
MSAPVKRNKAGFRHSELNVRPDTPLGEVSALLRKADTDVAAVTSDGTANGVFLGLIGANDFYLGRHSPDLVGAGIHVVSRDLRILMDQSAEPVPAQNAHAGHAGGWLCAADGRVLPQCPVACGRCSVDVDVLAQDQPQVPFAGDQHPVQALTAGTGDPSFGNRVRTRRLHRTLDDPQTSSGKDSVERSGELGVPVPEGPRGRRIVVARVLKVPDHQAFAQPNAQLALQRSGRRHQVNGADRVSGTYRRKPVTSVSTCYPIHHFADLNSARHGRS